MKENKNEELRANSWNLSFSEYLAFVAFIKPFPYSKKLSQLFKSGEPGWGYEWISSEE
jgi:hypothetical protein